MSGELLEIVTRDGSAVGLAERKRCHSDPSLLHRAIHVFIFKTDGNVVLQKRAATKDIQPSKWDTSVGGHMIPGETMEETAHREMAEELGITSNTLKHLYRYIWETDRESELIDTFRVIHDGPYTIQKSELDAAEEWSIEAVDRQLGAGIFTPNFELEWQRLRTHALLPQQRDRL